MKKLRVLILLFCICLSLPLAWFVFRSHRSLEQEEISQFRYFAQTLFDEMERELAVLVREEEKRAVDEYNYYYTSPGSTGENIRSPLSYPVEKNYIVGYFQNNPDGSFHSPLSAEEKQTEDMADFLRLRHVNELFNAKRTSIADLFEMQPVPPAVSEKMIPQSPPKSRELAAGKKVKSLSEPPEKAVQEKKGFAERFLARAESKEQKVYLGEKEKRVEKITVTQALNLARQDQNVLRDESRQMKKDAGGRKNGFDKDRSDNDVQQGGEVLMSEGNAAEETDTARAENESAWPASSLSSRSAPSAGRKYEMRASPDAKTAAHAPFPPHSPSESDLHAEIDPMQSVFIDAENIFIFRRIVLGNQIFRQGFAISAKDFLEYLKNTHFSPHPLSRFSRLELKISDRKGRSSYLSAGVSASSPLFSLSHTFPRPFSFLRTTLTCSRIPPSPGRQTLNIMMGILAGVFFLGMFAIYRSAGAVAELSERRSRFVSSVTHELKTPLTNIRMYIEMLEQGIARSPEREQEYFRILGSESARLSRLINNILEFSKLEKKQVRLHLRKGNFEDVLHDVRQVFHEKLLREGFVLKTETAQVPDFYYDGEVMIQVLINLIENSMKFGKNSPRKEISLCLCSDEKQVHISVSDTGPGIPRHALKKVFDDFYRVDSALIRNTRGTGIGLAFVKKVVQAMGGRVMAANNEVAGCSVRISLPLHIAPEGETGGG
ncbi:MAG: HAMP domain-containing sensor histidine kinase [Desulfococcaceae bacterium]|jgi:signal transduction histidine kinase|nr:HAMP domain-containing sensor histidine kinase [Desulfococcaceae bacterium]